MVDYLVVRYYDRSFSADFLAYKGHSIIWVAPLCAIFVALLSGVSLLEVYLGDYMKGVADYILSWFPVFFLGAIYEKIMDMTGSARSLANKLVFFNRS